MSVKLIAIDLDGTLLNSHHQITPAVSAAVTRAKEKGLHIILTSGRPFNGILPYLRELGLDKENHYCISNNGAVIHDAETGEPVIETLMDFEDYRYFEALARDINVHFHVLSNGEMFTTNRDISYYTLMDAFLTQTQLYYRPLAEMDSGAVLEVIATDPGAPKDFEAFCRQTGNALLTSDTTAEGKFRMVLKRK